MGRYAVLQGSAQVYRTDLVFDVEVGGVVTECVIDYWKIITALEDVADIDMNAAELLARSSQIIEPALDALFADGSPGRGVHRI